MLTSYRVLDLTDERGQLTGMMLSDLGADVILIEPPEGSRSRQIGPFAPDANGASRQGDSEASLWFWSYNRGKRSCVLDLDDSADKEKFLRLAATADVIIESSDSHKMAERGLSYEDLAPQFPNLIYTSISAFGRTGPKADWLATDLVVSAAGMLSSLMGDSDRAPLRIPLDQTFLHAAGEAALATLIALRERKSSGLGQFIDVSAQSVLTHATQGMSLCHLYNSPDAKRISGGVSLGPFQVRLRARTQDGYVSPTILFGDAFGPFGERLFDWIDEEGAATQQDREIDWYNFVERIMAGEIPPDEYDRIQQTAADFFATKTKREILEEAIKRRLLLVPIADVVDVVSEPHYQEFWQEIDVSDFGVETDAERRAVFAGPFAKMPKTPITVAQPPPLLGEHTAEVLADLAGPSGAGPTAEGEPAASGVTSPAASPETATGDQPLAGLRVLDFMWVVAGPTVTRILSDWGATVVRVESSHKVETARTIQPFLNDEGGPDNSGLYQNMNAGKLGITIDIGNPASRELLEDLIRWADVVAESFSPRVMKGLGLAYEDLCQINPQIIMASTCLFGQTGPLSSMAGYGSMGAAMSAFYEMTGWPDRDPAGVFSAYTDFVSPKFFGSAILTALEHRDRTGEGQHIDLSQVMASFSFLTPAVLDYTLNGRTLPKLGNSHPVMSPHGVFACQGEDRWLAIACEDDQQWQALCALAGFGSELAGLGVSERHKRREEIEEAISAWTQNQVGEDAQQQLQDAGVPAHVVHDSVTLSEDPQLKHRDHFRQVSHSVHDQVWVEGPRFNMSRSTALVEHGGPSYGEHTFQVLEELLGYDADKVGELAVAGVLE